ncbi:MAG: hypothetical protein IPO60_08210 [Flavobacteriales bacterium]|nr:hypothetical protein [Flavobacteriales bacterium]
MPATWPWCWRACSSAKVLLGSATPSMESLYNARNGKYGFAALRVRFGDAALPTTVKVDLADKQKRKQMRGNFSDTLMRPSSRL